MLFNFEKCKCLNSGHGNSGMNCEIEGTIVCQTVKEKDLEVTTNQQMGQACNAHGKITSRLNRSGVLPRIVT